MVFDRIQLIYGKYREAIMYLVFGGLTTLVNYLVYFPLYNFIGLSGAISNIISWIAAVVFAFITNKLFVFRKKCWRTNEVLSESARFFLCRCFTGLLETGLIFLMVDFLQRNGNLWKIVISVVVVFLNYFASKMYIFSKSTD